MRYGNLYQPNEQINEFRHLAKQLGLKLYIEEPIRQQDKILAIVNLALRTLSLVSQTVFAEEQNII